MKLARFTVNRQAYYGKLQDGRLFVVEGDIFGSYRITEKSYAVQEVQLLAPVQPGKVIAIGLNYQAHIGEFFKDPQIPVEPVIFMASPTAVIGPGEPIVLPYPEHETHFEAELVVVIGKEGRDIPLEKTGEYIGGYTCGNDVSDRTLQKLDQQWTRAKSFHTFKPLGPYLVTGLAPDRLRIQSRVNGQGKQESNTGSLIRGANELVSFISKIMTLYPGDVIYTGTPAGVGPLVSGDICEIEIEGIGILRNPVE